MQDEEARNHRKSESALSRPTRLHVLVEKAFYKREHGVSDSL